MKAYRDLVEKERIKEDKNFLSLVRKRGVRTLSGVAPIAVLTKPYPCPGKCVYCPTEKEVPKSYLSNEPAVMRAILCKYDPYKQVQVRLRGLELNGHDTSKIELIIMGGTWSYFSKQYQTWFVKRCFEALNEDGNAKCKMQNAKCKLEKLQKQNEKAKHRCVAMTLETRPDFINEEEIRRMRKLGCTKVEIGVQSLDGEVLKLCKRGHLIGATIQATKFLKDAGFKVCYHLMPNLPGSNLKKDLEIFEEIFSNPDFCPDFVKIYPCVVTPYSELEKWLKEGKYKPYTDEQLIDLIIKIKQVIPEWVRVIRVYRDIPAESVIAGSKLSNLRQIIHQKMEERGMKCKCVRCREVKNANCKLQNVKLVKREYESSGGREIFLSYEDKEEDKLISLLRLRFPSSKKPLFKALEGAVIIRDLHTYGQQVVVDDRDPKAVQHGGWGRKLVAEAERVAKENGFKKIAVISGIGARNYYRKLGYRKGETYMVKSL